jgi:hypothetical protein
LPFADHRDIYDRCRLEEPWDSHHERAARVAWLQCLSSPGFETTTFTSYVDLVGDHTVFPGACFVSLDEFADPEAVALVAEAEGLDIPWTAPRDLEKMVFEINSSAGSGDQQPPSARRVADRRWWRSQRKDAECGRFCRRPRSTNVLPSIT